MTDFLAVFAELKAILLPFAANLIVKIDSNDCFYLDTRYIQKNKQPLFFASAQIKKSYVSFHLMPIYLKPDLILPVSDALKSRMQGKSCFNFKISEPALIVELAQLTHAGFEEYSSLGYV